LILQIQTQVGRISQEVEFERKKILFFLDEVNVASCQWFIKDLISDRILNGTHLPTNVIFVCAVNPRRHLPEEAKNILSGFENQVKIFHLNTT
jgi:hypothetical protein